MTGLHRFDNVEVEEYADIDFNKDNISNNVNNNNNSNVINRDINNSNTINSNVNDSNMNAGTAGAYAGNTALDIVNPLMVCSYTGLRGLKMSVVEPNVELVQADTAANHNHSFKTAYKEGKDVYESDCLS